MRHVGTITCLGMKSDVVLCTPKESQGNLDETDHASFEEETGLIRLNKALNTEPTRVRENIVHEVVHKLLEASGARYYLRNECGVRGEAWDVVEETFVRMFSPALSSSLEDLARVCDVAALTKAVKK